MRVAQSETSREEIVENDAPVESKNSAPTSRFCAETPRQYSYPIEMSAST